MSKIFAKGSLSFRLFFEYFDSETDFLSLYTSSTEDNFFGCHGSREEICTRNKVRVSVQGVESLGGHFATLCQGFDFYQVKKNVTIIIFQKEKGNIFTLLIIFIVKSLQKEQNSTNLLL